MHRLRAAETGDIEAMTDLLLRHGPNPWNHLPEEGVRAHLRAIADGEVRAVLAERDDRLLGFASFRRTEDFAHYQPQRADAARAYICEAVVHPAAAGQGLGGAGETAQVVEYGEGGEIVQVLHDCFPMKTVGCRLTGLSMAKATLHWKPLTFTQREACMKIILIGASGTLGKGIDKELCERHEIVRVGHSSGDFQVDISDSDSIRALFEKTGRFDALVAAVGKVHFGALEEMGEAQYQLGLRDKLMGQVNLVLLGREYANDGGSFTLTSGVLAEQPIRFGSSASMVNCAVEGFVRGAALELPRGLRINAVSPTVVSEALPGYAPYFRGFKPVPAADAALGYARSVEGAQTGQVYRIW